MSRLMRLAVLVLGLVSLSGMVSSSAGAVTWDNSGATAFTATAGSSTLSSTSANLSCTSATSTATALNNVVGLTYAVTGAATYNGCTLSGIATTFHCGFTFTFTAQFGTGMGAQITGGVDMDCSISQFTVPICRAAGSLVGLFKNLTPAVKNFVGGLRVTNAASGTCPLGNGDAAQVSSTTFTVTSASSPTITRTP
jgi:hypothetical protein